MKRKTLPALVLFFFLSGAAAQPAITLQTHETGFSDPVGIAHCGDGRLFIVEQGGTISIIDGQGNKKPRPFLDITVRVNAGGNEQGLLGLAFHPDYKNNGYFFVNYICDDTLPGNSDNNTRISRFQVSAANPDSAVASSEAVVLTIQQPYTNHNGGDLAFGVDGYLYIPMGDGGNGGDPQNRAQSKQSLLGKILRIDVDTVPYRIPPDNPFINDPNAADEIWALGLRNPWQFSFDRLTHDMWVGDVGQGDREEVNFQQAGSIGGENYGWRCYEGNLTYNTSGCGAVSNYVFPVFDYENNSLGCSVVGGYVYRGCQYPAMYGYYIFCDYCSGRFWSIHDSSGTWITDFLFDSNNFRYSAFGEDSAGELYVAGLGNGVIYKVTEANPSACKATISGGVFTELDTPVSGVTVTLTGDDSLVTVTGNDGLYSFSVAAGGDYEITPSKNNDVRISNGVSTLDILIMQRHILSLDTLPSPYKIIAADGNGSGSVSTLDIVLSRSVILGNAASYPNGRLWEFANSGYVFPDPLNPFPFETTRSYINLASDMLKQDFIGIKLGDVNDTWDPDTP